MKDQEGSVSATENWRRKKKDILVGSRTERPKEGKGNHDNVISVRLVGHTDCSF